MTCNSSLNLVQFRLKSINVRKCSLNRLRELIKQMFIVSDYGRIDVLCIQDRGLTPLEVNLLSNSNPNIGIQTSQGQQK